MATANPAMNEAVYQRAGFADAPANAMTLQGTVLKTFLLLGILLIPAVYTWSLMVPGSTAVPPTVYGLLAVGSIGGCILAFVTIFVPRISPYTAPLYAALEGLALGGISAYFETLYQGIAFQAVTLTIAILVLMLMVYGMGIIRATERFKIGLFAATGAICLVYLANFVLSFFSIRLPLIYGSNWIGIGFSLVVVVIAALNLILDFDFIEQGVKQGVPKYMEWYGGFSLLVTLIWLYLEVLRLLAKLRDRGD
jgi:uncharacterized YccA/Bax inhibitor family protein